MIVICHLDSKKGCENYDYTTTGETTDDESEVELPKRKPKKRAFSDFIWGNYITSYIYKYIKFYQFFSFPFIKERWTLILNCLNFADNGKGVDETSEKGMFYYMDIVE